MKSNCISFCIHYNRTKAVFSNWKLLLQGQIRGGLTSCRHQRSVLVRCTFCKALGGICQTAVWRPTTGGGVFGQIHPQNSHQQSPAAGGLRGQGAFWLQRLPPARTQAEHGAYAAGIHSALCAAHPTKGFVRIRHYGFLSSTAKGKRLPELRHHLQARAPAEAAAQSMHRRCPCCKKRQAHHPRKLRLPWPTRLGFGRGQKSFPCAIA